MKSATHGMHFLFEEALANTCFRSLVRFFGGQQRSFEMGECPYGPHDIADALRAFPRLKRVPLAFEYRYRYRFIYFFKKYIDDRLRYVRRACVSEVSVWSVYFIRLGSA